LFGNKLPEPGLLLKISDNKLRSAGLSYQKAGYLKNIARFAIEQTLDYNLLKKKTDDELVDYLVQIKGVGRWTVEMLLMFELNRPDVFPKDDLGIQNGIKKLYKLSSEKKALLLEMEQIAENWRPYRTSSSAFFYRNDLTKFVDIAAEVGLKNVLPIGTDGDRGYYPGRMQWVDFDNDGDPDLSCGILLFRNDNGHFTEVSQSVGFVFINNYTWFTDWFDYDNDGDMDFFKVGYNQLLRNDGGTFTDVTADVSLDLFTRYTQASLNIGDFDNDGDADVFIQINSGTRPDPEALLLNDVDENGNISLVDVGFFAGMTTYGDRFGAAALDYDMDGRLDVFIPSQDYGYIMYHNLGMTTPNHWIGFDLWGTKSARDPLGSLVTLYAGGKRQIRFTKAATTWKIQDNPYVHFGIGQATSIDSVVIRWPLGNVQVLKDLAIDQYHKITESVDTGVKNHSTHSPAEFSLAQNFPNPFNPATTIEYTLPSAGPVRLEVFTLSGQKVATLVNGLQTTGAYSIQWRGCDDTNRPLPSGVYWYRLVMDKSALTKKMLLVR
ncbi:MAG TPA: FG-GAP-like repeat-containing protein, partial [bacterium]|nr:FG-GAP-like repeat-containing protein [bacterium]